MHKNKFLHAVRLHLCVQVRHQDLKVAHDQLALTLEDHKSALAAAQVGTAEQRCSLIVYSSQLIDAAASQVFWPHIFYSPPSSVADFNIKDMKVLREQFEI